MSNLMTDSMALLIILCTVSPMPMGLTPGDLSRAIRRLATKAPRPAGSTKVVHNFQATSARLLHRSEDEYLYEVHSHFQPKASRPEGPAMCV